MTVLFIDWMFLTSPEHYFRCIHENNKCKKKKTHLGKIWQWNVWGLGLI